MELILISTVEKSIDQDAQVSVDVGEAARFVELLTGSAETVVTWQTYDENDRREDPKLRAVLHGSIAEHAERLTSLNARGAGIFVMVNEGDLKGRTKENVTRIRAIFVDHDQPDRNPLASIETAQFDPDFLIESSDGKYHAYRLVEGMPADPSLFRGAQKALAADIGSDPAPNDLPRVMRVPGFIHRKVRDGVPSPAFKSRIHEVRHEGRVTSWPDMLVEFGWSEQRLRLGTGERAKKIAAPSSPARSSSSVASGAFAVQLRDGDGRNDHATSLAGICAAQGLDTDTAIEKVRAWNMQNIEPMSDAKLVNIVKRIMAKERGKRAFPDSMLLGSAAASSNPVTGSQSATLAYSELQFAQWFSVENADRFRYVANLGKWISWDGHVWVFDEAPVINAAKELARSILALAAKEPDDTRRDAMRRWNARMESARSLKSALQLAQTEPVFAVSALDLDRDEMLLAVDNGVINLETGAWREARPEDLMTKRAHVMYNREATCPRWLTFIHEVTCGDTELADYLQKMAGYCLTGSTREQALLLLVGAGSNGKSVFTKTLQSILGMYAVRLPASALAARRNDSVPADIAMLAGARVALASELNAGMQLDEARVKDLVSDDTITARHLYGSFFSFDPSHKLIVASNHLPIVAGTDHGIWRRIRVARFEARFDGEKRDVRLLDTLMMESSGILNWMIEGCWNWQARGLATPRSIEKWTGEYRASLDVVGQFIDECCNTAGADNPENEHLYKVGAAVLFDAYEQYARANGLPHMSGRALANELKHRGFKSRKSGSMVYDGLVVLRPWLSDRMREKLGADFKRAGVWETNADLFAVDSAAG